jgi:hypothetical protein
VLDIHKIISTKEKPRGVESLGAEISSFAYLMRDNDRTSSRRRFLGSAGALIEARIILHGASSFLATD